MGIITTLLVGAIAGWLAGKIYKKSKSGLIWNIVLGIGGGLLGRWLFEIVKENLTGLLGSIIISTIGAIIILVIFHKIFK